ncbi:MAG TPA: hypothetical protein VK941_03675, partial [Gillisia sp.]|nr:hypothetical protein [Gillisia sp.]
MESLRLIKSPRLIGLPIFCTLLQIIAMKFYLLIFIIFFTWISKGQELPNFFSDNMILQRNDTVPIWGTDLPFQKILIRSSWGNYVETISDENGDWWEELITGSEGGPHKIHISGSNSVEIKNVLLGEVWFASGQSNMDMPLRGFTNNPVFNSNEAILESETNNIRIFKAERAASLEPLSNVNGKWVISEPSESPYFSAIAYFYAKKIEENINVPIGIITSTWGGSKVQSWIEQNSINKFREIKIPQTLSEEISKKRQTPTALFNAMVHPFRDFKIKGI